MIDLVANLRQQRELSRKILCQVGNPEAQGNPTSLETTASELAKLVIEADDLRLRGEPDPYTRKEVVR